MTAVLPRAEAVDTTGSEGDGARVPILARERIAFGVLMVATAVLYLWNLSASGWANAFYSAAAQAGADNWTAMLFGSSDASNAITVDKTPAALWVMDLSVRLFGLNSWSVLVPQALEGVGAVALLYAAVRRASGPAAALVAGTVFALTPVAALMFRFNNPDALLVLLLVAGAYCVQRACERERQPVVDGRGGRGGRLRFPRQDAAGGPGVAELRFGVPGVRRRAAAHPAAAVRRGGRRVRRVRRLVPAAGRAVAVVLASVHRRISARQHRRIGLGVQRVGPAHR